MKNGDFQDFPARGHKKRLQRPAAAPISVDLLDDADTVCRKSKQCTAIPVQREVIPDAVIAGRLHGEPILFPVEAYGRKHRAQLIRAALFPKSLAVFGICLARVTFLEIRIRILLGAHDFLDVHV